MSPMLLTQFRSMMRRLGAVHYMQLFFLTLTRLLSPRGVITCVDYRVSRPHLNDSLTCVFYGRIPFLPSSYFSRFIRCEEDMLVLSILGNHEGQSEKLCEDLIFIVATNGLKKPKKFDRLTEFDKLYV